MRLAFITSLLPTGKPDTGFEIANACVLQAFADAGVDVMLFGFLRETETGDPPDKAVVLDRMVIETSVASAGQKLAWLRSSVQRGLPVIAAKLAPYGSHLEQALIQHGPFDAYIVNSAPVAAAFPDLLSAKPSILVAHNVEHASAQANAGSGGVISRMLYRREARLLQQAEHKALHDARYVLCLADEDRKAFGVDIDSKSAIMPLLTAVPDHMPSIEAEQDVGMIGTWTWQPNMAGLRWFLEGVLPKLPADMTVSIAGRLPPGFHVNDQRVKLAGRIPDATAFVAASRTIALTSRTGTGIQLKTIETFQMGKPSVATRSSIRGLVSLPTNCLVADDAKGFAAALTKLVLDVRSERTQVADGSAFVARQRAGMKDAVRQALQAIRR
jgi:hypothetical protein